jgi:putative pyruvate formate lyase activating enzyme
MHPSYLRAYEDGRLARRVSESQRWLNKCSLCPRMCKVNRLVDEKGTCRTGRLAVVASYGAHFGEEDPLVGTNGSGTIFFTHCNLYCLFCQNYDISHGGEGVPVTADQLANMMIELQRQGCHNINFVTPSHVIAQILEALPLAIESGLRIPLVYNCGGYERVAALKLLAGIVDIYMPDFKFWDEAVARSLCAAADYPERARQALREMHRQVGDLRLDAAGIAQRGLLVRHLVLPRGVAGTRPILRFIAREISPDTYVNVMDQYRPCGDALGRADIGRGITTAEYDEALSIAREEGLRRLDERNWGRLLRKLVVKD